MSSGGSGVVWGWWESDADGWRFWNFVEEEQTPLVKCRRRLVEHEVVPEDLLRGRFPHQNKPLTDQESFRKLWLVSRKSNKTLYYLWTLRSSGTVCGGLFKEVSMKEGLAPRFFSSFLTGKDTWRCSFRLGFSHPTLVQFWWRASCAFSCSTSSLKATFSSLSLVFSCLTFFSRMNLMFPLLYFLT